MPTSAVYPRALSFAAALLLGAALGCDGGSQPPKGKPLPAGQGSGSSKPIGGEGGQDGGQAGAQDSANASGGEAGARTPLVPADHPLYARFEGEGLSNSCAADSECSKGGCGGEICSSEEGANSTCEVLSVSIPASAGCGCVSGQCVWYTTDGSTLAEGQGVNTGDQPPKEPPGPVVCGEKTCAAGETCIEYYGIAGPNGPRFQTCGIPCGPKRTCPDGKSCVTVADGPGDVCQ